MRFYVLRRPHGAVGEEPEEYDSFETDRSAAEAVALSLRKADRENWYWVAQTPRAADPSAFWVPSGTP